ncbi:MAG: hypothetical protein JO325_23030, partial [Solirubrobacterales bacterium]|nr:hypothetical protein [Solirubrobacterales bacterium]
MLQREFSRLAIVGRGEPAMRIIHAARELGVNRADPLRVIALHTEADRDALFVRSADESVCLNDGALEHAFRECRADAAWVGRELASEHTRLLELCERLGVVFVGPDPAITRRLSEGIATDQSARVRRLAVPLIADGHGDVWPIGVCDGSCQRRGQTLLAESSSSALTTEQEREIMDAARRLASAARYRGAVTVELLYDPATRRSRFTDMTARPGVEYAVIEAVTGLDLAKLQLLVAAGGRLEREPPPPAGHAIEARLCAEDSALGFAPAPGRLARLRLPTGPGIRVDAGVAEGDHIPAEVDPMICKLI